ncbi:hypothetical protein B5S28_g1106 [[Candida] boidinii]|uniref:Unnamed protein product n=1 Tax=Candida boidinii TaxID=5477 RepID=A0ACB5TFS4_CANBO|nr:hypothetical protein B5S28_g1106 [[Candida] boidinii]OWB59744.1 hypothetical protein B5S29_g607 [[Candida] boidinii]GME87895.1 unnamed protein product [[Candida] boidinii]
MEEADFEYRQPEEDDLGYEFRVMLVTHKFSEKSETTEKKEETNDTEDNGTTSVNAEDLEEVILAGVTSFSQMNEFLDEFDSKISYPNEGFIKYDVGSDGVIVMVVDNTEIKNSALRFIAEYTNKDVPENAEDDERQNNKKSRK